MLPPDTTPATPTPEGYRKALALIDDLAGGQPKRATDRGLRVEDVTAAVYAVARAAVASGHAHAALNAPDAPWLGDGREALAGALDATSRDYNAAVADLCALAVGGAE